MTDRVEGRPLEDVELARLARDGDVQAYGELVEGYREVAFRTAWLITRSSAEAEDAAQEAFVKAFYALDRFRAGEAFRPWGLRIVSNEAKNGRGWGDEGEVWLGPMARLSERERLVVTYRYLLELSEAETARALAIRPGTVKSRLSRALGRLRDQLEGSGDGGSTAHDCARGVCAA